MYGNLNVVICTFDAMRLDISFPSKLQTHARLYHHTDIPSELTNRGF